MVTTNKRPRPHVVPTSSPSAGRPQKSTSSLVPHPIGDEVELASSDDHPATTPPPRPRDEVKHDPETALLLLAAKVASITGDAPGTLATLNAIQGLKDGRR